MVPDYAIEYRNVWKDGSVHWAEIHARLVRGNPQGSPRLVGVSLDTTDRKTNEERLRRLNESLEERVVARTHELNAAHAAVLAAIEQRERAEEQLRQSQKLETIGQLTGGVAHDFNNLLTAVLGNLELLRKHLPTDAKTDRLFNGAMLGAQRGAALTQRLLAFARQQDLKIEAVNLTDLIRGAANLIERSAGSQIEIQFDLPSDLPMVLVDANQVELAVINLVVNARDAMPKGGSLMIGVNHAPLPREVELSCGDFVCLHVIDNGEGMDAATLKKATEPFFSTKEVGKGTGLGLSMVQGLAVQLKGALRLISEVGHGTTVELWLPTTCSTSEQKDAEPMVVHEHLDKITILVVDDDELIAMSTVDMLEDFGHDVIEVNSGAKALEVLRGDRAIDLMITDFLMPRMNGAQLAAAARQLRPELPILLATGYAELSTVDIQLPRIAKPYQQDQLLTGITQVLTPHQSTPVRKS
jgi:signal transduction histidine kinase/CheY-like chemotaxis protein